MRRYTPLLLTAFLLFLIVVGGSAYMANQGDDVSHRPLREISVYTTLPAEHAAVLATAYEKEHDVRINFIPLASGEILSRLADTVSSSDSNSAAMILADKNTLKQAAAKGYLQPYISENGDQVAQEFRQQDGYWVGVW